MMDTFCRVLYILIVLVYASEGQQHNATGSLEKPDAIFVPFCGDETKMHNVMVPYFDSNETHICSEKRYISTNFTRRKNKCPKGYIGAYMEHGFEDAGVLGFTYNSSLIHMEDKLIPPENYCWNDSEIFFICYDLEKLNPAVSAQINIVAIYLSCLSISTICYFGSAIIYYFILKVQDDHMKCFVGFSLSMGVTFTVLILLQVVNNPCWCDILGSLFFMFLFSSFVWLTSLCADTNLMIRHYREDIENKNFYLYISLAILFPCSMTLLSLLIGSMGSPDVPSFFMKQYSDGEMCEFKDNSLPMFFIPTGLLALLSTALLCHSCFLIWLNEKQYRNDFKWLEKRSELKYTGYECLTILIIMVIFYTMGLVMSISTMDSLDAYQIISSLQGVFIVIVFIFPYIKKEPTNLHELRELRPNDLYELGSCSLLILPTAIWIINVSIRYHVAVDNYVLDCIEATQGIFAVVIFVFNRYTRRKILYALSKNKGHQPLPTRWQDLVKRFEDDTVSPGDK